MLRTIPISLPMGYLYKSLPGQQTVGMEQQEILPRDCPEFYHWDLGGVAIHAARGQLAQEAMAKRGKGNQIPRTVKRFGGIRG